MRHHHRKEPMGATARAPGRVHAAGSPAAGRIAAGMPGAASVQRRPSRGRAGPAGVGAVCGLVVLAAALGAPRVARCQEAPPPVRFQSTIESFLREDRAAPPPKGGVLFIGSSVFRQWSNVREQMAPLPVLNRAFGGSRTAEVLHYMDRIVLPYEPRIIVYYCGSNDINAGERPADIAGRFRRFSVRVAEQLPRTRLFYVSIIRAPQKRARWGQVDSTNALVRAYCDSALHRSYIDVNPIFFDRAGNPRAELYKPDMLHLTGPAYAEIAALLRPAIEGAWRELATTPEGSP